jgi:hypothetical protein
MKPPQLPARMSLVTHDTSRAESARSQLVPALGAARGGSRSTGLKPVRSTQ